MRREKSEQNRPERHRPKHTVLLLVLVVLLISIPVVGTLTYLIDKTDDVGGNPFTPAQVSCVVNEDLSITNKSNVQAYIRAMVVVNWIDESGNVYGKAPNCTISDNTGWKLIDGIFYYQSIVPAYSESNPNTAKISTPAAVTCNDTAPSGYTLTVQVIAEAIQAEGMGATSAQEAWAKVMP